MRILCPVDFSDASRHAVDHALALARWYGGTITAAHVIPPMMSLQPSAGLPLYPPIVFTPQDLEQFRSETTKFVEAEGGSTQVNAVVVEGSIATEIVQLAESLPADIVVMGTHGRSGFERLLLGSVTERVLRKAPCPVLTVPPRAIDAVPLGPVLFTRILCAIDFSPSSLKALDYAVSLSAAAGARLSVVHVLELIPTVEPVFIGGPGLEEFHQVMRDAGRKRLHEMVSTHGKGDGTITEVVGEGKAYREILRVAAEERSDLIVIGAHGGVAGVGAFGSTTNHIVRQATCPVLSLKA